MNGFFDNPLTLLGVCVITIGVFWHDSSEQKAEFETFVRKNGTEFQTKNEAWQAFQKLQQEKEYKVFLEKLDSEPKLTRQAQEFKEFLEEQGNSDFETTSEAWIAFEKRRDFKPTGQLPIQVVNEVSQVFREFKKEKAAQKQNDSVKADFAE